MKTLKKLFLFLLVFSMDIKKYDHLGRSYNCNVSLLPKHVYSYTFVSYPESLDVEMYEWNVMYEIYDEKYYLKEPFDFFFYWHFFSRSAQVGIRAHAVRETK